MALTYSNFNTFDEVASYYERIKPLRGANNVGKDIRPIGDRKRKHERIVKVSDNCYALSDGWHYGDDVFKAWYRNAEYTPTSKDMEFYAVKTVDEVIDIAMAEPPQDKPAAKGPRGGQKLDKPKPARQVGPFVARFN